MLTSAYNDVGLVCLEKNIEKWRRLISKRDTTICLTHSKQRKLVQVNASNASKPKTWCSI